MMCLQVLYGSLVRRLIEAGGALAWKKLNKGIVESRANGRNLGGSLGYLRGRRWFNFLRLSSEVVHQHKGDTFSVNLCTKAVPL